LPATAGRFGLPQFGQSLPDTGQAAVEIRAKGNERIIAPLGQSWDSFFQGGPAVSDDFLPERANQLQTEREAL
jgi:antitoxin VapB